MGASRRLWKAALCAAILLAATWARASTVVEPIARLSLEGGYDSNALYDGSGADRMTRISPDVGLRLRDHTWDLHLVYGGDWVYYERRAPDGFWNHRALLKLEARPGRRTRAEAEARGFVTFDQMGLALMGIFRTGRESARILQGRGRFEYRADRSVDVAGIYFERSVVFGDRTGGAMHQPSFEALYRWDPRLSFGGAYALSVFQELDPTGTAISFSHALRGRMTYRLTRQLTIDAYAGPAMWHRAGGSAVVPEASVQLLGASRAWEYRLMFQHGLGIGTTARPGLVNTFEFGASRRFMRRFELHADGGVWNSGLAPTGANAVTGYAVAGEAAILFGGGVRLALAGSHFARLDDPSPALKRSTIGLRLGWELPHR
jgi:hypothetical protein